jgi:mRNA-degrading endonuclease RelE of RelBE toxin-antitoxin system
LSEPDYILQVGKQAAKYIGKLDKPTRARFAAELEILRKDPIGNSKPLVNNPPSRSCRVGGWRIILVVDEPTRTVVISIVMPRGQVYDRL